MKNLLTKIFLKKTQEKSLIWIFYLFLLTLPFTIRKVLYFFPIKSAFNEYSGIYIYFSDLFATILLLGWFFTILNNKKSILSTINKLSTKKLWISCVNKLKKVNFTEIFKKINFSHWNSYKNRSVFPKRFFDGLRMTVIKNCSTIVPAFLNVPRGTFKTIAGWNIWKDYLSLIPLILTIWSFASILWSENQLIAFFRSIKILEFFLLYLFIRKRLFHPSQIVPPARQCQSIAGGRGTIDRTSAEQSKTCHSGLDPESPGILNQVQDDSMKWNIKKNILCILIFWGSIQSIMAIWQFISQKSLGLTFLKESIINPDILGVAKVIIGGEKYIRSYGLFPHPNILGGFLLLSLVLTYLYKKHFLTNPMIYNCSTWNNKNLFEIEKLKYKRNKVFFSILIILQIIALFLTFSKSAIIGLFIAIFYIFINSSNSVSSNASYKTSDSKTCHSGPDPESPGILKQVQDDRKNKQMFHVEHSFGVEQIKKLKYYFLLSFVIFGILLFYFKIDLYALFIQSLEERFIYLTASIQAISQNLLWGLGNGQFVLEMGNYSFQNLAFWQYQPVHNVFLLILSELGMIGLFLFIWFLLELFYVENSNKKECHSEFISESQNNKKILKQVQDDNNIWNIYLKSILLGFVFIMIFDHYFWDIQQGSLMLWLIMGLISVKE